MMMNPNLQARCGFTVTVNPAVQPTRPSSYANERNQHPNSVLPPPSIFGSSGKHHHNRNTSSTTKTHHDNNKHYHKACDKPPQIENGVMSCRRIAGGSKKCSPVCNDKHDFYQRFSSRLPSYLCNRHRVDWNVRRFIPDCSPIHETRQGRSCPSGWETRSINQASQTYRNKNSQTYSNGGVICVACPPGMYRTSEQYASSYSQTTKKRLCQLCPKGMYSDQFGSSICRKCPLNQTTRGLGSRKARDCYYARYDIIVFKDVSFVILKDRQTI